VALPKCAVDPTQGAYSLNSLGVFASDSFLAPIRPSHHDCPNEDTVPRESTPGIQSRRACLTPLRDSIPPPTELVHRRPACIHRVRGPNPAPSLPDSAAHRGDSTVPGTFPVTPGHESVAHSRESAPQRTLPAAGDGEPPAQGGEPTANVSIPPLNLSDPALHLREPSPKRSETGGYRRHHSSPGAECRLNRSDPRHTVQCTVFRRRFTPLRADFIPHTTLHSAQGRLLHPSPRSPMSIRSPVVPLFEVRLKKLAHSMLLPLRARDHTGTLGVTSKSRIAGGPVSVRLSKECAL
jgi:hypothetical protein